jgi:hypothetical protein
LLAGTFAAMSPSSFIIKGANAQSESESYNYGMDNSYHNYNQNYGMDSYDKRSYDDNYGKNSYGNSYGQDYQSDYKKDYSSYDKYKDFDKSKDSKKSVSINKFNCINTNINLNGNNTGNISIGNKGHGYLGANSYDGGYSDGYGNNNQGKSFDCVINNNNTNTNIDGGNSGNQTIPPEQRIILNLTKEVACQLEDSTLSVQQAAVLTCERILADITPIDFSIQVAGNNPQPNTFNGSATGTNVTIGPGDYTVTETPNTQVTTLLANANVNLTTTFAGGCSPTGTGTIDAGVAETCIITNTFTINKDPNKGTLTVIKKVGCAPPGSTLVFLL